MSKSTVVWLAVAGCLILAGCIAFGILMSMLQWDFSKLSTGKYETNQYEITEDFRNISVLTDTADVALAFSQDSKATVLCREQENEKHTVRVENGTLFIEVENTRSWHDYVGFNFGTPKITVTVPQSALGSLSMQTDTGDLTVPEELSFEVIDISTDTGDVKNYASAAGEIKVKAGTGDILVENMSSGKMELSVSTGKVTLRGVSCKGDLNIGVSTGKTALINTSCANLTSQGSTGDILLENTLVAGAINIKRSTGDVSFDRADAFIIAVHTGTGNISGTLLSGKVFTAHTDTGEVRVPQSVAGGACQLTTGTGDIQITVEGVH